MADPLLSYQARLDSFSTALGTKKGRKARGWTHPPHFLATPATLADAGFVFAPSADDPDNVRCFACDKQLADWDAHDDPFAIHFQKCAATCAWATARCGLETERDADGRYARGRMRAPAGG
jgi:hypothetical protein